MVENLVLNNFIIKHKLHDWIFDIYKKTNFTYMFMIISIFDNFDPNLSIKNPVHKHWEYVYDSDTLDKLYDKVREFKSEAEKLNKQFFAIRIEDDESGFSNTITIVTKDLISVANEESRYKEAKYGKLIPGLPGQIPDKYDSYRTNND